MNFIAPAFTPASAEIVLLTAACVVLLVDVLNKKSGPRNLTYWLSQATLGLTLLFVVSSWSGKTVLTFSDGFIQDRMSVVLKVALIGIVMATLLYSRDFLRRRGMERGEYYLLCLFATLGMMVMVSAYDLLNVYLGLELLSLSMYAMAAFDRRSGLASEAAMKFFVLGSIASGLLLYGMSLLYGVTGTLNLAEINGLLYQSGEVSKVQALAMVFVVVAIAFKLGVVPFHMWMPDVYHGAPTCVALFVGAAPKIAAFAMAIRLLSGGLEAFHAHWHQMLMLLAVVSIAFGNVVAIAQSNIKRMLAYSTISHAGFILLGIMVGNKEGFAAAMFYAIIYAMMSLGAFGVILALSRDGDEYEQITDFAGLAKTRPWIATIFMLILLAMTGVPPTAGFYAKFVVLKAVVGMGAVSVAVFAVVMSVIGAFYYLRVLKVMYFDEPRNQQAQSAPSSDTLAVLSLNGLLMLVLGILPGSLLAICLACW